MIRVTSLIEQDVLYGSFEVSHFRVVGLRYQYGGILARNSNGVNHLRVVFLHPLLQEDDPVNEPLRRNVSLVHLGLQINV